VIHVLSSTLLTAIIVWWGAGELRAVRRRGWSEESRMAVALAATVLASGALSFNYSRDRLGGMAVPFYAIAAYFALRALATRALLASRGRALGMAVLLFAVVAGWQTRAIGTVEHVRATAWRNHMEWFTLLHDRRAEFGQRPDYMRIMEAMVPQGRDAQHVPRRLLLPEPMTLIFGEP
jgi:hypothetical protein